jgi:hypothetical protein
MTKFSFLFGLIAFTLPAAGLEQSNSLQSVKDAGRVAGRMQMKTESFDRDPGWLGVNNRSARMREPVSIRQDFGFSAGTNHAGGNSAGEMGGFISPAGEVAYYGMAIEPVNLDSTLTASGTMRLDQGGTHVLLGFFNSDTVNEWRTPNTIALRLNGRGEKFFAYVEYCTSKWRAGGDTTPFPSATDPQTGRLTLIGFPCDESFPWSLAYDPQANQGRGAVTATIGDQTAVCNLDVSHKQDGARFNRFGIMNVMKSADRGSEAWFDDIAVNGGDAETFSSDPKWNGRNNRRTAPSRLVRPRFDFGYSNTHFADGNNQGELGGQIFRGDCRYSERMACYGDRVGPLTLERPLKASGKITMTRGVTDSTTLIGFYHSQESMRQNESQSDAVPESIVGIHIEGPSSEGFKFYPVLRMKTGKSKYGNLRDFPTIYPDGKSRDWSMEYHADTAAGRGRISVTLDGKSASFDFELDEKARDTSFDRFGIVTSWIDGNSQDVYWDDISYTVAHQ